MIILKYDLWQVIGNKENELLLNIRGVIYFSWSLYGVQVITETQEEKVLLENDTVAIGSAPMERRWQSVRRLLKEGSAYFEGSEVFRRCS